MDIFSYSLISVFSILIAVYCLICLYRLYDNIKMHRKLYTGFIILDIFTLQYCVYLYILWS